MIKLHIDYETYSEAKLKKVGQYRYAADPSSEILLMAVALEDEEPVLWVPELYEINGCECDPRALQILKTYLPREDTVVYAHNASFEIAITKYLWPQVSTKIAPPRLDQWRCTQVMARRAALPQSLANIGAELNLELQKDKRGESLIKTFSIPRKPTKANPATRIYPWDAPEDFAAFGEYCLKDVVVERQVERMLREFDCRGLNLDAFQLHNRINDRGLPINVPALKNAIKIVHEAESRLGKEFDTLTGLRPTQRDKVLSWLRERGYPANDLQADTMEKFIEDDSWGDEEARRGLQLRAAASFAATKKLKAMLDCNCGDGMVRGTLQYYGAFRTGRSAGQLIQPQNYKRPTIKHTDIAYQMIQDGVSADELEMIHGNPIEVVASCIRHFIHDVRAGSPRHLLDADYAGVEARIVAWLADQEDTLEEFRAYDRGEGPNAYELMAAFAFDIPVHKVAKDGIERFIGKQTVLGGGFGMGAEKFRDTCRSYGQEITLELAEHAIRSFREKNYKIAKLWTTCDKAARQAIENPGKWIKAGNKIAFARTTIKPCNIDYLVMRLPSKRTLVYPRPSIEEVQGKNRDQITFYGIIPGPGKKWGRVSTYGGKLVENATQATAADFMMHGAVCAEKAGFEICGLIHDEALAFEHPTLTIDDFCAALCTMPEWGKGMPLASEGKVIPYYLKA